MKTQEPETQIITALIQDLTQNHTNYYINITPPTISLIALTPDAAHQQTAYHYNTIFTIHTKTTQVYQYDTYHGYTPQPFTLQDPDSIHKLKQLINNHKPHPHPGKALRPDPTPPN